MSPTHRSSDAFVTGLVLFAAIGLAATPSPVRSAAIFSFTSIAKSGTNLATFITQAPQISTAGTAVFTVQNSNGDAILTGDGIPPLRIVANESDGQFEVVDDPATSDSGRIAFVARPVGGPLSIITIVGDDLPVEIASEGDSVAGGGRIDTVRCVAGRCDIADDGTVVFHAILDDDSRTIFTGNGGELTPFLEESGALDFFDTPVAINNEGQRAAIVEIGGNRSIVVGENVGNIQVRASEIGGFGDFENFSLNDNGAVAFIATHNGVRGVFLAGPGGPPVTIADSSGPYDTFRDVALNDFGQVVFSAKLDAGAGSGLFTGDDPVANKVVGSGDRLFNRTLDVATLDRNAINIAGQMAFLARFNTGPARVIRANPVGVLQAVDRSQLDAFAQLSTMGGTGIGMSQAISFPGSNTLIDLSFDLEFLTDTGLLSVALGELALGVFGPDDAGPILFTGIDPQDLFDDSSTGGGPPSQLTLDFQLTGPPGSTVRLDNIVLAGLVNGDFELGYFDGWGFDTALGGAAIVSAFNTPADVPEPGTMLLFGIALAGLGFARRCAPRC